MIHVLVVFLIVTLAVARVTKLIVEDTITFPIRRAAVNKFGEDHPLTTLIHCVACTSVWVGTIAAFYAWLFLDLPGPFVAPTAAAFSYTTILLSQLTR